MTELKIPDCVAEDYKILRRGVEEIIPEQDFIDLLAAAKKEGRPLVIKTGFDPTAPHVHLGWSVVLRKMRQFQDLGHDVVFLFGDFTAMIGDPSGKSKTRRQLTREEVLANAHDYKEQVCLILDPEKTRFEFNSKWCAPLTLRDTIELASRYTVTQLMQREDFKRRHEHNEPIGVHELLYPLLQGYDSIALKADVEMGGYDQRLNLLVGRELMRNSGMAPQCLLTMPILVGLDGVNKMSQSLGNYVGLTEPPREMFGKLMSIADPLIEQYFILCTDVPEEEVKRLAEGMASGELNPRDVKARLATEIVAMYHSREAAGSAEGEFNRMFREKGLPDDIPAKEIPSSQLPVHLRTLMTKEGLAQSKSEARRLIVQGGVRLDGEAITDAEYAITKPGEYVLKVGKRRFLGILVRN